MDEFPFIISAQKGNKEAFQSELQPVNRTVKNYKIFLGSSATVRLSFGTTVKVSVPLVAILLMALLDSAKLLAFVPGSATAKVPAA